MIGTTSKRPKVKNRKPFLTLLLLTNVTLTSLWPATAHADTVVTIQTPVGSIEISLLDDEAPQSVANFLGYVNRGDYTGTFIHRSEPGFVIQGGGYLFNETTGQAPHIDVVDPVVNEFGRSNIRGTVAMAKLGGDPDSATSEWFINLADNSGNLDNQNGGFTVFGIVTDGMSVADEIAGLPRFNFGSAFGSTPTINFSSGSVRTENLVTLDSITIAPDFDGDGVNDSDDPDDDNDGVADTEDVFPFDATESVDLDNDGIGNNADTDDDADGVADADDVFPEDGDEWADSDEDGIGDNADEDQQTVARAYLITTSSSANFTVLHAVNSASVPQGFTGWLYNGNGEQLGADSVALHDGSLASRGRLLLTAAQLETLFGVEPWSGPAMLEVTGTADFDLMSKLTSPSGLISNTNCVREDMVHNIESSESDSKTFIRFINTSDSDIGDIQGTLYDENGQVLGATGIVLLSTLASKAAVWVNRDDFIDLAGVGWDGTASLKLDQQYDGLKLLNLNFVNNETFFNFSCFENDSSGRVYLMTNASSLNVSETHLINTGTESISFTGTLWSGDGDQIGIENSPLQSGLIESNGRLILTATDLESLTTASTWSGPAMLEITTTDASFELMTRLTSPSGLTSNTNCVRSKAVHNIEGFDSANRTFVRFINQGDTAIDNIGGVLYDINGETLGSGTLIESLGVNEAIWKTREDLGELLSATWDGEASLVVTADLDDSLRLLNLNFVVAEETFFNFSCFESSQ